MDDRKEDSSEFHARGSSLRAEDIVGTPSTKQRKPKTNEIEPRKQRGKKCAGIFQLLPKRRNKMKILDHNHIAFGVRRIGCHHIPIFTDGHEHGVIFQIDGAVVVIVRLEPRIGKVQLLLS